MRRRKQPSDKPAIRFKKPISQTRGEIGIVLSGGGARAAYQVGALRALAPYLKRDPEPIAVVIGSSIGAINGLILGSALHLGLSEAINQLEALWRKRTFRNTFVGSPSSAFFRAVRIAVEQYLAPGPGPTDNSVFDPTPLMEEVEAVLRQNGGLSPDRRDPNLRAVAVMTTLEGQERKPLLFLSTHKQIPEEYLEGASFEVCYVNSLTAKHGFASAALPSVLPPVELDTQIGRVRLVDGGISQNVPVDPAVRLGADKVVLIDISGRLWWMDRYGEPHDKRPSWEVPADYSTFCLRPPDTFVVRNQSAFGPILKHAVAGSSKKFIAALGPTWPIFRLLKAKLGEEAAYEAMTYVALDPDYLQGILELGYNETMKLLRNRGQIDFHQNRSVEEIQEAVEAL